MKYERIPSGTVLCHQGEQADRFYVIVTGQCGVTVWRDNIFDKVIENTKTGISKEYNFERKYDKISPIRPRKPLPSLGFANFKSVERQASLTKRLMELHGKIPTANTSAASRETIRVGTLKALECFGENALLGKSGLGQKRAATVTTEGDTPVQVLSISNEDFFTLVNQGILDGTRVLRLLREENEKRLVHTDSHHNLGAFKMVNCYLCNKWRHVDQTIYDSTINDKFMCRMVGEKCATGVLM